MIPERQTNPPEFEDENMVAIPDPAVVIDDLPHAFAQELIEELNETHFKSGRTYIAEIVRLASIGDDLACARVMRECIASAGDSEVADKAWLEVMT